MGRNIETELCTRPSAFRNFNALRRSHRISLNALTRAKNTPTHELLALVNHPHSHTTTNAPIKHETRREYFYTIGELAPELELFHLRTNRTPEVQEDFERSYNSILDLRRQNQTPPIHLQIIEKVYDKEIAVLKRVREKQNR